MGGFGSKEWVKKRRFSSLENWSFWEIRAKFGQLLKTKNIIISNIYGGSAWESNTCTRFYLDDIATLYLSHCSYVLALFLRLSRITRTISSWVGVPFTRTTK